MPDHARGRRCSSRLADEGVVRGEAEEGGARDEVARVAQSSRNPERRICICQFRPHDDEIQGSVEGIGD